MKLAAAVVLLWSFGASAQGVRAGDNCPQPAIFREADRRLRYAATTNIVTRSQEIDHADWLKQTSNATAAPVVTANAAVAPDGTLTAERVQITLPGDTEWALLRHQKDVTATRHTASVWLRANGAGQVGKSVNLIIYDGGFDTTTAVLTADWRRYVVVASFPLEPGIRDINIGKHRSTTPGGLTDAAAATDFFIWGAQLEVGIKVTPYIATAATAVARPAGCYSMLP